MAKKRSKLQKSTRKKYLVEMTSLSVLLWSFCLFFLLGWIFVLGILVGRGLIPGGASAISEIKGQITKLQEIVGNSKVQVKRAQKKTEKDPEFAFYERLSSKKVEVKNRWQSDKDVKGPINERVLDKIKAPPKNRLGEEGARPVIKAKPRPLGNPPPALKGEGKSGPSERQQILSETPVPEILYTVQLASLGSRNRAEQLINELADRGYPAYYYEAMVRGKTYFRVRSGEFFSSKEAGSYAENLTKDTGIKGFVSRFEERLR